jgi:hypothetical protein
MTKTQSLYARFAVPPLLNQQKLLPKLRLTLLWQLKKREHSKNSRKKKLKRKKKKNKCALRKSNGL